MSGFSPSLTPSSPSTPCVRCHLTIRCHLFPLRLTSSVLSILENQSYTIFTHIFPEVTAVAKLSFAHQHGAALLEKGTRCSSALPGDLGLYGRKPQQMSCVLREFLLRLENLSGRLILSIKHAECKEYTRMRLCCLWSVCEYHINRKIVTKKKKDPFYNNEHKHFKITTQLINNNKH